MAEEDDPVEIEIHQSPAGSFFVWICEMAFALRTKHRIYGRFVGTLPRCQHQNSCLGLPLLLSPEEASVARKQPGVKVFRNTSVADRPASPSAAQEYEERMKRHYSEMMAIINGRKRLDMVRNYHKIRKGLGKRQTRLLKKRSSGAAVADEELSICDPDSNFSVDDLQLPDIPEEKIVRHLPTATPKSWLREEEVTEDERYPEEDEAEARLRFWVFEDLWKRGRHITVSSAKMGGDFLIYPGDPLRFHASHIVVLSSPTASFAPSDITSVLRLGSSVKKMVVLASESSASKGDIEYTTLAWAGVG